MQTCYKLFNNKRNLYIIFWLVTLVQLGLIIYTFQTKKQGCHSDELWSYGYANSYYDPSLYIHPDGTPKVLEKWYNGTDARDYLVVNEGEEFTYDSVYYNQINDLSPPLHSMILHTICSFFPEKFSLWYSFAINIVAFLITMIFLYRNCAILKSEQMAVLVCTIYGFSQGAIDNFIYLRMYALCTAFLMIILYCFLSIIKAEKGEKIYIHIFLLFGISLEAFLTHYYMISICGILTFLFCVHQLLQRKFKRMFQMGLPMLIAFLMAMALFPSLLITSKKQTTAMAGNAAETISYEMWDNIKTLLDFITQKEFGIVLPENNIWLLYLILGYAGCIISLTVPFIYLFRKSAFIQRCKEQCFYFFRNFFRIFLNGIQKINWIYAILCMAVVFQIVVVSKVSDIKSMGIYADRYLFYVNPVVVWVAVAFCYTILKAVIRNYRIRITATAILGMLLLFHNGMTLSEGSAYYFSTHTEGMSIEEAVKGKNVVFLDYNKWFLTAMADKFMYADSYFMTDGTYYYQYANEYLRKMQEGELILIVNTLYYETTGEEEEVSVANKDLISHYAEGKSIAYKEMLEFFDSLDVDSEIELLSKEEVFRRHIEVFCVNPK